MVRLVSRSISRIRSLSKLANMQRHYSGIGHEIVCLCVTFQGSEVESKVHAVSKLSQIESNPRYI